MIAHRELSPEVPGPDSPESGKTKTLRADAHTCKNVYINMYVYIHPIYPSWKNLNTTTDVLVARHAVACAPSLVPCKSNLPLFESRAQRLRVSRNVIVRIPVAMGHNGLEA